MRARSASRVRGEERGKIMLLSSRATRISRSPRFLLCSPKICKKLRLFYRVMITNRGLARADF